MTDDRFVRCILTRKMDTGETRRRGGQRGGTGAPSAEGGENYGTEEQEKKKTRSRGWCTCCIGVTAVLALLVTVAIVFSPCPIEPVAYSMPEPPEWTGPLAPNELLTKAERLYEHQLEGPESMVSDGENIYTGLADGRVVRLHKGEISTVAQFGKATAECGKPDAEEICGRPLGVRLDKDGHLLVADAYMGIYRVNLDTGEVHQLLSAKDPLAGQRPMLLNDIEEGPDGTIYFTDTSVRWNRRDHMYTVLEPENSGRLLSYNPATLEVKELMGGLAFANGIAISDDKTHILVVETTMVRIMRYYLTGPRKGESEVFMENLPGIPDNIRASGRGTYWLGFGLGRKRGSSMMDFTAPRPWIRKLLIKLFSEEVMRAFTPKYGLAVEISKDGEIIRSLHDPTGKQVPAVSEVLEKDGILYLGSYALPFLSRLDLRER